MHLMEFLETKKKESHLVDFPFFLFLKIPLNACITNSKLTTFAK